MFSYEERWRLGVLVAAQLAVTHLQSEAERYNALAVRVRDAIDQANREPKSSDKLDEVWKIMMSEPGLKEILEKNFPGGTRPRPFRNDFTREIKLAYNTRLRQHK